MEGYRGCTLLSNSYPHHFRYVAKCQQVSEEKNQLESSLLHTNERSNDLSALQNELLQTREHNTRLMSDLEEEKVKVREYEELMRKYYDNNILLKDENANLQLAVETESTNTHEERGGLHSCISLCLYQSV